jgi:hypothetical protein
VSVDRREFLARAAAAALAPCVGTIERLAGQEAPRRDVPWLRDALETSV